MSEHFQPPRGEFRQRLVSDAERDQQEIQDWLNANGSLVFGAIIVIIAVFLFLGAVTG